MNNKIRQWILGSLLIITLVLIWWLYVYAPLRNQHNELAANISQSLQERDRLTQRMKSLSDTKRNPQKMKKILAQVRGLVGQGNSLEEVSARTQWWVQEFMENHDLTLKAYNAISPSKWRDYPLSRVQFQMDATTQGLSDLLENLENLEQAVRIEKLGVNYRRSRESDLYVSLDLGTLFVEGLKE